VSGAPVWTRLARRVRPDDEGLGVNSGPGFMLGSKESQPPNLGRWLLRPIRPGFKTFPHEASVSATQPDGRQSSSNLRVVDQYQPGPRGASPSQSVLSGTVEFTQRNRRAARSLPQGMPVGDPTAAPRVRFDRHDDHPTPSSPASSSRGTAWRIHPRVIGARRCGLPPLQQGAERHLRRLSGSASPEV